MIQITIPGKPLGKQRHQTAIRQTKDGRAFTHEYTPEQTVNYETFVALLFTQQYPKYPPYPPGTPLFVIFEQIMMPSKDAVKQGLVYCTTKPDEDNCKKIVYDSLNQRAMADDCQIAGSIYLKRYDPTPGVNLTIMDMAEYDQFFGQHWWLTFNNFTNHLKTRGQV
jgi:Holliday junction resolvase RusA-like endonuclease